MSDYKFDGRWLKNRSGKRIAQIDKDYIKDDRGAREKNQRCSGK